MICALLLVVIELLTGLLGPFLDRTFLSTEGSLHLLDDTSICAGLPLLVTSIFTECCELQFVVLVLIFSGVCNLLLVLPALPTSCLSYPPVLFWLSGISSCLLAFREWYQFIRSVLSSVFCALLVSVRGLWLWSSLLNCLVSGDCSTELYDLRARLQVLDVTWKSRCKK